MPEKITISLPNDILVEVETLARELEISRSRLFTLAVEAYIQQHRNRKMLVELNAVYAVNDPEEEKLSEMHQTVQRHLLEGECLKY